MCKLEITLRKFLKLFLEIEFYNIVIYFIFIVSGYKLFSLLGFIYYISPIHAGVHQDFIGCYLLFFLLIPFLSILVNQLNRFQHLLLLTVTLLIYTIIPLLPGLGVTMNYVSWFCVLFLIGSFLRLHPLDTDKNTKHWALYTLVSLLLAVSSVLFLIYMNGMGYNLDTYRFVADSNAPLAVLVSASAFMFFKNLKIKQSKFINTIGGGTFAVLLIHANSDTMRHWLWRDLCDNVGQYATNMIYIHAILIPIAVFIVCSMIEYIRMKTIEKPLIDYTYNFIRKYFPNAK